MNVLSGTLNNLVGNGGSAAPAAGAGGGGAAGGLGSLSSLLGAGAEPLQGIAQLIDAIGQGVAGTGATGTPQAKQVSQGLQAGAQLANSFGPIGGIVGSALGLASSVIS
ncbi:hypothetical protein [Variovorax sp.]|uniref:hypothetical protein n=1 Tax=Variovorax sp. TaxID=1871043 RepID=UPI002D421A41|nr:hypothetical protein [Variovorax sp.]HYP82999.1 hypothetical protein [Variovorax sp.]